MNQRDRNKNLLQYQYRNLLNIENIMTNTVVRIPEGIPSPQVSLFENMVNVIPVRTVSLWEFLLSSRYKDEVTRYRQTQDPETRKKIKMFRLPCVTVSGVLILEVPKGLSNGTTTMSVSILTVKPIPKSTGDGSSSNRNWLMRSAV